MEHQTEFIAYFANGDSISGKMNTSPAVVKRIFSIGNFKNIGFGSSGNIQQVKSVEILSHVEE